MPNLHPRESIFRFSSSIPSSAQRKKTRGETGLLAKLVEQTGIEKSSLCRSSFAWNSAPYDIPDMLSKPGTPCNDYNGYCDVFQRCREVIQPIPLFSAFLISCHLCWMKQGTVFHLYLIPLSILITQRLTRQILIRQGGSQRTVGNSEKATLVGRQPSKLPTMDDRSLVHRCSNYPPLTFDLGKFSFPMFPVQFFFFISNNEESSFFLIINIEEVRKQYSG